MQEAKDIDRRKWEACINLVRTGFYFRKLLREREMGDPELEYAKNQYMKAKRKFKRMQRI